MYIYIYLFSLLFLFYLIHFDRIPLITRYLFEACLSKITVNDFTQLRLECKSICMFYTAHRATYGNAVADA